MRRRALLAAGLLAALLPQQAGAGPVLLLEADTGRILYTEEQDDQWHPASLTKIMTAYITFEALKAGRLTLESKVTTSETAHLQPPSKVGLPIGGQMSVELALQALIVKSANDVAVMLGEAIGGSEAEFVKTMNVTARRLGMSRTNFANPNGLPAPDQVTTARDLAKLSRAVIRDFPEYAHYWQMSDMRIGKRRLGSHNSLLKTYDGADGLKTGFICDSGFNVVATASRDGKRLVAIVLGETSSRDRAVRASSLLEHGFQMTGWKQIFNSQTIDNLPMPTDAKGPVSIRETVTSWDCGSRQRARAVAQARIDAKKQRVKAAAKLAPATGPGATRAGVTAAAGAPAQVAAAKKTTPKKQPVDAALGTLPAAGKPPASPKPKAASAPPAAPITTGTPRVQ